MIPKAVAKTITSSGISNKLRSNSFLSYLRDVSELTENITFAPASVYEADEPEEFFE